MTMIATRLCESNIKKLRSVCTQANKGSHFEAQQY